MWTGQLVVVQAEAQACPTARIWKQIRAQEQLRLTAKCVKYALGKTTSHAPLAVVNTVDSQSGAQQDITQKCKLEMVCLEEAGQRFTQASSTPFLVLPLVEMFREVGLTSPAFQAVLDGTFNTPGECDRYVQKVLRKLVKPMTIQQCGLLTLEEYISGWRKAQEAMLLSPSSIHFGHYIVGMQHPDIAQIKWLMAHVPLQSGYSRSLAMVARIKCDVREKPR